MKPPLTYYGGKQKMTPHLLPLIPQHNTYCEPFFGGGALFFAKPPSKVEIINDTNSNLINFYRIMQNNFTALQQLIENTLHSRRTHQDAQIIYNNPHLFTALQQAWSVWVLANQSYTSKLNGSFGYDRSGQTVGVLKNKRLSFPDFKHRLETVTIENRDALSTITTYDTPETFFYCDPPYIGSDQGHYSGYQQFDFSALLDCLSNINGKFLRSSYPNTVLTQKVTECSWYYQKIEMSLSVSARHGKKKTETITANYQPLKKQSSLFEV